MKKVLKQLQIIVITLAVFSMHGCFDARREFEFGDFICIEWFEEKITILDVSETGKQKRVLVVPEEVNSLPVIELRDRYASGAGLREYINSALDAQSDQADTNLQTNMEDSITRTQEERTDYLDSLATPATTTTTGTAGATTTTATE